MKPICVPCRRFFRVQKNGYRFTEAMPRNEQAKPGDSANWQPYKLWQGDLYRCQGCGTEIISGVGFQPVAERHDGGFHEKLAAYSGFAVYDC